MAEAISQPRQSCQFHFCLMKNPLLYRSAWPESSREASEGFVMETLARTQSERRPRLALAVGFGSSGFTEAQTSTCRSGASAPAHGDRASRTAVSKGDRREHLRRRYQCFSLLRSLTRANLAGIFRFGSRSRKGSWPPKNQSGECSSAAAPQR